jgi:hypothetical protein
MSDLEWFYFSGRGGGQLHAVLDLPGIGPSGQTLCGRPVNIYLGRFTTEDDQPTCRTCRIMRHESPSHQRKRIES